MGQFDEKFSEGVWGL